MAGVSSNGGEGPGHKGSATSQGTIFCRGLLDFSSKWAGRQENPLQDYGDSGHRKSLGGGGVSSAAGATHASPSPTASRRRLRLQEGNHLQLKSLGPAEGAALRGGAVGVQDTGLPGGLQEEQRAPRSGRSAERRPGGGARKQSQLGALVGYVAAARRGSRVRREGAQAAAGAQSPLTLQLPRTLARPPKASGRPPRLHATGARALARKASQPLRAGARALGGASASRSTWPGEESPVRDRACAMARARPSAGKEHAQCEGTGGYVGARGMLRERREPAHAQKRSEPATHWWRKKREITSELRQERPRFAGRLWLPAGLGSSPRERGVTVTHRLSARRQTPGPFPLTLGSRAPQPPLPL